MSIDGNTSSYSQIYIQYKMLDVQITHLELLLRTKLEQLQKCRSQQLILKQKIQSITLLKFYKFLTSLFTKINNIKTQNSSSAKFPQKQSTIIKGTSSQNTSNNNDQQQQNCPSTCKLKHLNVYDHRLFNIWDDIIRQIKMKISCTFVDRAYFCKYGYLFQVTDQYQRQQANIGAYNNSNYGKKNTIYRCQQIVKMNLESSSYSMGAYTAQIALRSNSLKYRQYNKKQQQTMAEYLKFLAKYDDRLEQVKKEEVDTRLSIYSNFPSCPQQCWNSIQYLFEGQILTQQHCNHKRSWKTFCIPYKDTKNILDGSQYHLVEEMICRSANFGGGVIYMGIDAIEDYRKTDQIRYSIDDEQALLYLQKQKKILSDLYGRSYEVYGQPRTMLKQKNIRQLRQRMRKYSKQACKPKQLIIKDRLDIVPVYKNKIKRLKLKQNPNITQTQAYTQTTGTGTEQDNNPNYVIKITLTFEQLPTKYLTYIQLPNNQCYLYGEVLGVDSIEVRKDKKKAQTTHQQTNQTQHQHQHQNRLYCTDIYNQILKRYNNYKKISKKCKQYTIQQSELRNFQRLCSCWGVKWGGVVSWMEIVIRGGDGDGGEDKGGNGQATVEYLQTGNLLGCTVPTSGPKKSDPTLYGCIPDLIFNHSSIVVISQSGMKQINPSKIEQFQSLLKQSKLQYQLYDTFFQKLQNRSSRKLYIITHQKKYQILKKYSLSLDPKQRSLKLFNIRPQLTLLNSKQFSQAINTITIKFKTLFNTKYKVGQCNQKDQNGKYVTNYYFQFNNKMEACFVFVCLEFQLIKSQFVNKSKVQGLKMFEY